MRPVVGITGPAGSGKSTLAGLLARRGFALLSLDRAGHQLLEEPDIKEALVREFSSAILRLTDGAVSRRKLADIVFADPRDLERLDRIVHPHLTRRARRWLTERRRRGEAAVVEGALLYELGLADLADAVFLLEAPFEERLRRLASRGWDARRLAACDRAQAPAEKKLAAGAIPLRGELPPEEAAGALGSFLKRMGWLVDDGEKP